MSNFTTKPQLPTEEDVRVRDGVPQRKGYISSRAGGVHEDMLFDSLPASGVYDDGTIVFVKSGSDATMHLADVTISGGYRQIV